MIRIAMLIAVVLSMPADSWAEESTLDRAPTRDAQQRARGRRAAQLRRHVRDALRREALSQGTARANAVDDLIQLYIFVRMDRTLTQQEHRYYTGKVRSRLIRVKDRLTRMNASDSNQKTKREEVENDQLIAAALRLNQRSVARSAEAIAVPVTLILAQQGVAGAAAPAAAVPVGAAPAQVAADYGDELVDLIQNVIAPSSWVRNGGPGSIYYYRPLKVLVVNQTTEVHEDLGGALGQLRAAGN